LHATIAATQVQCRTRRGLLQMAMSRNFVAEMSLMVIFVPAIHSIRNDFYGKQACHSIV
jgi:hypothetical protein